MIFILCDLEATCFAKWDRAHRGLFDFRPFNEIIEIGAHVTTFQDDFLTVNDSFHALVHPFINPILSQYCKDLTNLSQELIDQSSLFPLVYMKFKKWVQQFPEYRIVTWGNYDCRQFVQDCRLHDIDPTFFSRYHFSLKHAYMKIRNKGKYCGLKSSLEREGFHFEGTPHSAMADAWNMQHLLHEFFDKLDFSLPV